VLELSWVALGIGVEIFFENNAGVGVWGPWEDAPALSEEASSPASGATKFSKLLLLLVLLDPKF